MGILLPLGLVIMLIPGAEILGGTVNFILFFYESLCNVCDKLPGNTWTVGHPSKMQVVIFYVLCMVIIIWGKYLYKQYKVIFIVLAVWVIGWKQKYGLIISFLDVGQGDCILVQTEKGNNYLFDGGSSSESNIGSYVILPYLKYYGVNHLDAIFVSHPDKDHYSGILELLETGTKNALTIDQLILPAIKKENWQQEFQELLEAAKNSGQKSLKVSYIAKGSSWESGSVKFTCLHPPQDYESDTNAYSECFLIQYNHFSLLLTGDVEEIGEEALLQELYAQKISQITALKVAHHGSKNSTSEELLSQLNPKISIISCSQNNRYKHPHPELLERLGSCNTAVFTTFQSGAVRMEIKKNKVDIHTYGIGNIE